jgi:hypothetical protein
MRRAKLAALVVVASSIVAHADPAVGDEIRYGDDFVSLALGFVSPVL